MQMATEANEMLVTQSQIWLHNKNESVYSDIKSDVVCVASSTENQNCVSENEIDENDYKASSSEASEIANLADVSISDDKVDSRYAASDTGLSETKRQEISKVIEGAKCKASTSIDLSKIEMLAFPDALSHLPHLEYMYLEGNKIVSLPEDFFRMFPHLRWLDLRNNLLSRIPFAYLSSHSFLRNLLLEGNNLRSLPLELGLVKSLQGLNIAGNPLDFPPPEIIERGTQYILYFLKDLFQKCGSHLVNLELQTSKKVPPDCEKMSASSDDWNTTASMMDLAKKREAIFKTASDPKRYPGLALMQEHAEEAKLKRLHKSSHYIKNKHQPSENLEKIGESEVLERINKKDSKMLWRINPYPTLPTRDYVTFRMNEEKHLAKVKEVKEKIDAIIQRQKDDLMLKKWRDVAKRLQHKKYAQRLQPGKDYEEPSGQAPFGIEAEMMKVLSKEDRQKADLQREAEFKQQRCVLQASKLKRGQEREKRILELEHRIKEHTAAMVDRRKQPKGTPHQEIEIARRELNIAEQLHNELLAERRET